MTHASVCTGVGMFELAAAWNGWRNVFTSEIKPYCCNLLQKRFPDTTHYGDFTTKSFRAVARRLYRSRINVLSAGIPCQPFSVAGLKKGQMDERHLGPAFVELCATVRPPWAVVENVAGFVKMALNDFTSAMEAQGYACQAFVLPACAVGAPHRRDRVWIVCYNAAYADCFDRRREWDNAGGHRTRTRYQPGGRFANLTNALGQSARLKELRCRRQKRQSDKQPKRKVVRPKNGEVDSEGSSAGIIKPITNPNEFQRNGAGPSRNGRAELANGSEGFDSDPNGINGNLSGYGTGPVSFEQTEALQRLHTDANEPGSQGERLRQSTAGHAGFDGWAEHWYEVAARICRMDDGHATGLDRPGSGGGFLDYRPSGRYRTARLEAGGNGLVPHIPYEIYSMISRLEDR